VSDHEKGIIEVVKTKDLKTFYYLGAVLKRPFHVSYPFVFAWNSAIFMIPETAHANEIALYKFIRFPNELIKLRILLEGQYFDSSIIEP